MTKINWHRQHKWSGITAALLLIIFSISGFILNHRGLVSDCEVSRHLLPPWYEFKGWNGGLLRGTIPYGDGILIYGSNGIWRTDSAVLNIEDFNAGLPDASDHRQMKSIVKRGEEFYTVSTESVYLLTDMGWEKQSIGIDSEERLSDATVKGDSLVIVGRSNLYLSPSIGKPFKKIELSPSPDSDGKVTLFKTVWMIHSGELFGMVGKIIVDIIAAIFIILSLTGLMFWLMPKFIRHKSMKGKSASEYLRFLKPNLIIHNKIGTITIFLTMLIAITGWCLRPPVMIPLALTKIKPLTGSTLDSDNPWNDKLRMLRYDELTDEWLLSTSEGFFSMRGLDNIPRKCETTPPVSVMGLNVFERDSDGSWLCGSFSGMFRWERHANIVTDYFSGEIAESKSGPPFGKYAVSGYSKDFDTVVEYYDGTDKITQSNELRHLPMSLWNVALETHSGRLFIGPAATYVFIFITGLIVIWCIFSGWKARKQ